MTDEPTAPALDRHETLTVGVIVERRKAKNPWQDFVWQPVEAVVPPPPLAPWTAMREEGTTTRFFAGPFTMELYPRETVSYKMNLDSGSPSIYVVLREDASMPQGVRLELASPSPADAEAYMDGAATVDKVPMDDDVTAWLAAYIETFHVEEQFRKRKRGRDKPKSGSAS